MSVERASSDHHEATDLSGVPAGDIRPVEHVGRPEFSDIPVEDGRYPDQGEAGPKGPTAAQRVGFSANSYVVPDETLTYT